MKRKSRPQQVADEASDQTEIGDVKGREQIVSKEGRGGLCCRHFCARPTRDP